MALSDCKGLPGDLWCTLGRIRIGLGVLMPLLALVFRAQLNLPLFALLGFFTVGFIVINAAGLSYGSRHKGLIELGSIVFGLGAISCLVLATGGPDGPLASLFLVPVFTHGFRSGLGMAYLSAAINSVALIGISAYSAGWSFPIQHLVGPLVVMSLMWMEARAVGVIVRHMALQRDELVELAERDPLTGLLNRRSIHKLLFQLIDERREFAVILVDLDRFKAVNDEHGHLFGDEVLKRMAEAVQRTVRGEDFVVRYGGDEFAVIVRGGREEAESVMWRLRETVATVSRDMEINVGLSGGIAVWPADGATFEELLQVADRELYRTKELKSRNRQG